MTWQEKYEWLRVKFLGEGWACFSDLIDKAVNKFDISEEKYNKLYVLYKTCPSPPLDCNTINQEKFGNKTILAVNLLYKLVKDNDNIR